MAPVLAFNTSPAEELNTPPVVPVTLGVIFPETVVHYGDPA